MKTRGVHLQYSFQTDGQRGAEVANPLFDLLSAVHEHGSIQHAAKAAEVSYRHFWGGLKHWEQVLGEPLVSWAQGRRARLTPFAERLLWAETRARTRLTPHIEALRVELERVLAEALDGSQLLLTVFASHDLALPRLREVAAASQRLHVELRFTGSMDALQALAQGRCAVAGFHVPALQDSRNVFARGLKPLLRPGQHKLIGCVRRRQGLMVARGNPLALRSLADVAAAGVRLVNRQPGSGTRLLLDHLLAQIGLEGARIAGYGARVEDSHVAAAAAVASAGADVALGIEAAAAEFDLDFVPLVEEDYFLVCLAPALDRPEVQALRRTLQLAQWTEALAALPGYRSAAAAGEVLSLTRALPWWHFRQPRAAGSHDRDRN